MLFGARKFFVGSTIAGLLAFQPTATRALESPWADAVRAQVRLLAAGPATGAASLRAGIEFRLTPGWYTYWRYPGDAGVPPRFDWSGSKNLASVEVLWPAPERIPVEAGLESIGYKRDVIFPLTVRALDPAQAVLLRLKLDFGVCQKICIPASAALSLEIPAGLSVPAPDLDAAAARVPVPAPLASKQVPAILAIKIERANQPRALIDVAVPTGQPFDLFAEGPTDQWTLPLPARIDSGTGRARFSLPFDGAPAGSSPIPPNLRLTLTAGERAIEVLAPLD
jgi:DsbC/DsbD-like thiol-disulfide interchange protein